ncbi:MAG TPA: aldehyde ferredoxin oxidoreductase C-terminal domain-containing protein, partial [Dissulfurispiraceae bacterium]|nr:aldehyde ferredoxin oxidoreductase C-terminal domain-containing protein [Dissulfurispiraceae bacterium]
MFKSPLTGNLGESHAGGRSAVSIRMAGYGAIVIKGASERPCYLSVQGNKVFFRDASTLWGMGKSATVGKVIRTQESSSGLRTIMRIGRAGEKMIPFACVTTETYRHFGRLGLGAVFGSKKLKALVVSGKRTIPVADQKQYDQLYAKLFQTATASPLMKKYHEIGTPVNIVPLNESSGLPTRNVQSSRFEHADAISGETVARNYLGKRLACAHCPVACIHIAAIREPYEDEPYFYKTSMIGYDYELIYAAGSMLGGSDVPSIMKLIDLMEAYGVDVMSAGVVLAWATEAFEKGLITLAHTSGVTLAWGNYPAYTDALSHMVEGTNEFYQALSKGVEHASSIYGGAEYAMAFGKNEMPGYHTGPAAYVGYLVGARHSHLDGGGYGIDKKISADKSISPETVAKELLGEERWRQILSSLVVCFFARELYKPETVVAALQLSGFDCTEESLRKLGEEIHTEKFRFKLREGFSFDNLRIARRIYETPSTAGMIDEQFVKTALSCIRSDIESKQRSEN